jgi:hypothetical protein
MTNLDQDQLIDITGGALSTSTKSTDEQLAHEFLTASRTASPGLYNNVRVLNNGQIQAHYSKPSYPTPAYAWNDISNGWAHQLVNSEKSGG